MAAAVKAIRSPPSVTSHFTASYFLLNFFHSSCCITVFLSTFLFVFLVVAFRFNKCCVWFGRFWSKPWSYSPATKSVQNDNYLLDKYWINSGFLLLLQWHVDNPLKSPNYCRPETKTNSRSPKSGSSVNKASQPAGTWSRYHKLVLVMPALNSWPGTLRSARCRGAYYRHWAPAPPDWAAF